MAFIRFCGKKLRKNPLIGLLVTSVSVWIIYLTLRPISYPTLRIKDYFSSDARKETLNNGRLNTSYLPIHDPVITPHGFSNSRFLFIILVLSSPTNVQKRNAIRKTWGRDENWNFFGRRPVVLRKQSYRTAFVIGTSSSPNITLEIRKEISTYHDILLGNFTDSYKSLNIKVFMALKWSLSINCKYILKADDDIYVNVPQLSMWLDNKYSKLPKDLYSGLVHWSVAPMRTNASKHFLTNLLYSRKRFPPYCAGLSYILSRDVVSRILNASRVILPLWIDDVYIGMLVHYLGVRPLEHEGFRLRLQSVSSKELKSFDECFFLNTFSYGHQLEPKELIHIHGIFRRMNSRSNGHVVFKCMSKDLAFMMSVVVPSLLLSITGILICVGVLTWIRSTMLKRTGG